MEEKKHICKYCGKEFETSQKLGGHIVYCSKNPKSKTTQEKSIKTRILNKNYNNYDIQCPICGKYKQLYMTQHIYESGKYTKTCSRICARKLSEQHIDRKEINLKISKGVKRFVQTCTEEEYENAFGNKRRLHKIKICKYCGKEFLKILRKKSVYCCDDCMKKARHEKLRANAKRIHFGGLNPETTHKHYHRGYYNNIWCDSSWELAFLVFNIENGKNIKRYDGIPLEYDYKGVKRKYYPDFQIDNELYEIKGKFYDNNYYKMKAYPNIHIISKNEIKEYIKYVSEKYGEKFWEVLYN